MTTTITTTTTASPTSTTTTTTTTTTTATASTPKTTTTTPPSGPAASAPGASGPLEIDVEVVPATLNVEDPGVLTMTIHGSDALDVRQIDLASIRLLGALAPGAARCEGRDLFVEVPAADLSQAINAAIGRAAADRESVTFELTGSVPNGPAIHGLATVQVLVPGGTRKA
jgi:hypothetical protein